MRASDAGGRAVVVTQWFVRIGGLVMIGVGLLLWARVALFLLPVHMLLGLALVLALWGLAAAAARAGAPRGQVALAAVWGLVVPALGVTQAGLLPGSYHWVIQVVHLLVGLGLLAQADTLAAVARHGRLGGPGRAPGAARPLREGGE